MRSTPNSGSGTPVTPTPHDTGLPATGATAQSYTANPTPGTLLGLVRAARLALPLATTLLDSPAQGWDFGAQNRQAAQEVVLRGTNAVFALNGGGTNLPGAANYDCNIEYTEE